MIELRSLSAVAPKYFILLTFCTAVPSISSGICLPEIDNNLTGHVHVERELSTFISSLYAD